MKRLISMMMVSFWIAFLNAHPSRAQAKDGFDKLTTLVGEWEGTGEDGVHRSVRYELISGGTALWETLSPENEPDMVTVYTLDDDHLALTHFCSANNQPRMTTEPLASAPESLVFTFAGGTNLEATQGHMVGLVVTFEGNDHFTQRWTWKESGNDHVSVFHFTRTE
jgi:hypothetical protein